MSAVWTEASDPSTGKQYWYNAQGDTTWVNPGVAAAPSQLGAVQPVMAGPQPVMVQAGPGVIAWPFERFGCFDDIPACCLVFWCPCIAFGKTMERMGLMSCAAAGCMLITPWIVGYIVGYILDILMYAVTASASSGYSGSFSDLGFLIGSAITAWFGMKKRKEMTAKYRLPYEDDMKEFCFWWCCECCTILQEYRTIMRHVDLQGNWVGQAIPGQAGVIVAQQPVQQHVAQPAQVQIQVQGGAAPPAVPQKWTQHTDPASGKPYWSDGQTTTWDNPNA